MISVRKVNGLNDYDDNDNDEINYYYDDDDDCLPGT